MKTAQLTRCNESHVHKVIPTGLSGIDIQLYSVGRKRVGDISIRIGTTADDFVYNQISIVTEVQSCRIPRILNPLHKRKKSVTQRDKAYTREGTYGVQFKHVKLF